MTGPEVSMDFEAVQAMADAFSRSQEILNEVSQDLEQRIRTLEMLAFFGVPGKRAIERYEAIRLRLDAMARKCQEMNYDLMGAIVSLRDGDSSGSRRFLD